MRFVTSSLPITSTFSTWLDHVALRDNVEIQHTNDFFHLCQLFSYKKIEPILLPVRVLSGSHNQHPVAPIAVIGHQTPGKRRPETHLTTSSTAANMLPPNPDSSPLSSPPLSLASAEMPSLNEVFPQTETIDCVNFPVKEYQSTTLPSVSAPASRVGSPPSFQADEATELSPKHGAKRALEDDGEQGKSSLRPRKCSNQPEAVGRKPDTASIKKVITETAMAEEISEKSTPKSLVRKKPTALPPTPCNRPTRSRKAPERFEDLEEHVAPRVTPRTGPSKVFDPVFITTNSTSRLSKADVYHMLLEDSSWTNLTAEQQVTLLRMLPEDESNRTLIDKIIAGDDRVARPQLFTISNDCFRTDVAKFKEDLRNGHLAKTWQAAAEQAVTERAAGHYDDWKAQEAEQWWGQKSKHAGGTDDI